MEEVTINETGNTVTPPVSTFDNSGKPEPAYSLYFREQHISYSHVHGYLAIGSPDEFQGWLIHISIVRQQFDFLIRPILAFLKAENLPFAIPADAEQHSSLLDGRAGFHLTGKTISIQITPVKNAEAIVFGLSKLTRDIIGPVIPCAYHLTSVIAVEYGRLFDDTNLISPKKSIFYGSSVANSLIAMIKTKNLTWPFRNIRPLKAIHEPSLLNRQYIPIETFKNDLKGNVMKALKLNSIYNMQWCVLKQGRQYQSFDNYGRDATDRIKWQYQIHQHFADKGILPKPIAYFELQGDSFFAMEYMESVSLSEKAAQLSEGNTWRSMPVGNKKQMIGFLLQITKILGIFHQAGFVHRDVTAANFIIAETGEVYAIDIELCYDLRNSKPNPPLTLGTLGYMSPDQATCQNPSIKDDIYSFGALLISVLTGVLPNKLNHGDPELLAVNLGWYIDSPTLITIIVSCFAENPEQRPELHEIQHVLELYDAVLITNDHGQPQQYPVVSPRLLENVLTVAIKTLSSMVTIAGYAELYVLIQANNCIGTDIQNSQLNQSIDAWLERSATIELPEIDLHIIGIELSRFKTAPSRVLAFMNKAFPIRESLDSDSSLSIADGLAGRGLKLLYLMRQPRFEPDPYQLAAIANNISKHQRSDGSWASRVSSSTNRQFQVTGFSYGVAGITYFLLCYHAKYGSDELRNRIRAALNWLIKQRKTVNNKSTWTVSTENDAIDPWLEHGFSGVALTFIKAYEVLEDQDYKNIASSVLHCHPLFITSNYCSFGNGLSGLGEIYLEAYRVFKDDVWYHRASSIAGMLLNCCYRDKEQCYWLDGTQLQPIADFWSGNAGVLHFLLRFAYPNEISFPNHLIK